ncbi:MAG: hypothetical protein KF866_06855 [Phycisphaeraceae bacterium]|nr:hypothetical protein [Phycisphaeraceae bacterium]MCW5755427.1 hypothetical protein [Phycisphaeraceae bacterium]
MATSYKSLGLFNSGPHRVSVGSQGQVILSEVAVGGFGPGSIPLGLGEPEVRVTGRLAASSEAGLWALRDEIVGQLVHPPTPGEFVDHHGRTFAEMSFIRFIEGDRTDRGREHTLAYTAVFRRFHAPFASVEEPDEG